jgi:hypothetical protein
VLKAINIAVPVAAARIWAAPVVGASGWAGEPGIRIVGAILGILLVVGAIRAMFGKRNGE